MSQQFAFASQRIFDGECLWQEHALLVRDGKVMEIVPQAEVPDDYVIKQAGDCLLAPGFVDLQVNGGGGVLFNNQPDREAIETICRTHAGFGTTSLLVTLISDSEEVLAHAIRAGQSAVGVPGFLGLHLEGPHLSQSRKGTHDPAKIRAMTDQDLTVLAAAAGTFGRQLITIAPESVSLEQVRQLVASGYVVSLGHTDATANQAMAYAEAGATMVTHLFNAMSQLGNREPGLVGAALEEGRFSCGLIADGFHVDSATMNIAIRAKNGPGRVFLVTDAMSTIGTQDEGLTLNGRQIYRREGCLTLADGTLAGADIDMLSCVRYAHTVLGLPLVEALRMASRYPAEAIAADKKGQLKPGFDADFVFLDMHLNWHSTFIAGAMVAGSANASELLV
ncbi:N-acetylglucosamine-6-phosphate deacetylase [Rhizobium helianthi]|uniref:N-acetylglucosamine-6-phosphate deacetylase n=1 Tax=Rhizobium helianthi TaxID=1132695 RepID=A0ABW4M860_9HYPH